MGKKKTSERTIRTVVHAEKNTEQHIKRPIIVDDASFSECSEEFQMNRNTVQRKWSQLSLTAETERIKFRALNYGEHSSATRPYRYAVAIVDTSEGTAKVFDGDLFVGQRIVKNLEAVDVTQANAEDSKAKTLTGKEATDEYYRSRTLLGESFGTRKTKQILNSLDRNKIDIDHLATQSAFISKGMDSSISRIAENQEQESPDATGVTKSGGDPILPPHNKVTKKVEDIYKLQDLIPPEAYFSLDVADIVAAIQAKESDGLLEAVAPYDLSEYTESRVKSLATLTANTQTKALDHTARCLIYLDHLIKFRGVSETRINGDLSTVFPMATPELVSALLANFAESVLVGTGQQRYKLSSICRDRLVAHICILVLTLDGFRTNAARLSAAIQLPMTKLSEYMKAVGCALERPGQGEPTKHVAPGTGRELAVKMAVLKAPLTIIPPKSRGGPRR